MSAAQSVANSAYPYTPNPASSTTQAIANPFLDPNGPFANLSLTSQQRQQIRQIFSQNQNTIGTPQSVRQLLDAVDAVLTPLQQRTLQSDLQTLRAQRFRDGIGVGSSSSNNALAQLNLSSAQQSQISQIFQSAQAGGASSRDILRQIDRVLTAAQQQQLASLRSPYTSSGAPGSPSHPYVINTIA
ncbi:MAG TPA: hypothetical protein VN905_10640 [Candidatus Binatia bacterium]|nr:hypothetical protein [Candidatus Binatia bacterium]